MPDSTADLETGEAGLDRAGEGLVGIGSSDIEERVTAFGCERFCNDALNRRVLVNMRSCFVSLDDCRGPRYRA
jgi:hypothetical protein